jgi:hypothetical protein
VAVCRASFVEGARVVDAVEVHDRDGAPRLPHLQYLGPGHESDDRHAVGGLDGEKSFDVGHRIHP